MMFIILSPLHPAKVVSPATRLHPFYTLIHLHQDALVRNHRQNEALFHRPHPAILGTPTVQRRSEPAPLHTPRDVEALVTDQYIVKYSDVSASSVIENGIKKLSAKLKHFFKAAIRGFAAKLDQKTLDLLRDEPNVSPTCGRAHRAGRQGSAECLHDPVWCSLGSGPSLQPQPWRLELHANYSDFGGRASRIYGDADGNGHGIHVAGIIGSNTYGVAKRTTLFGIKVLDDYGSGSYSDIIAGIDFVISDARSRICRNGAFVNMSLGGDTSATISAAAYNVTQANIFVAVAAGNGNVDAADFSPTNESSVIDIFVPGQSILSTYVGNGTRSLSGTSRASPHVVGLAAYLSSLKGSSGASATCQRIIELATTGLISGLPSGIHNRLVFNGNSSD
ncbi:hypothetical protein S7711_01266 [Stachybotrys chartarum IBT 7711]|uniref:Peptidase S8/S53 domain-containing protein n=1 Tax=Stachybotrys chartarum (strain CBS 109288 / IBT 7711) TaxID=1280523 RepID=A0A084BBI1_STACB|nr:hypothetical protein S7711_01266 [Stachybotrys chartarum IBT 7711]